MYDSDGNVIVTATDGEEIYGYKNGVYYYVYYQPLDDDYVKYIYFPENKGYSLKCIGENLGLVDCTVSSITDEGNMKQIFFKNIEVDKGTEASINSVSLNSKSVNVLSPDTGKTKEHLFETSSGYVAVENLLLSDIYAELEKGTKKLITATITPVNATNRKLVWVSDNEKIAKVNSDGVISAISEGTAIIKASVDGKQVSCKIIVTNRNGRQR